ncbi:MAG: hypothetical protein AAGC77_00715 [Pseudomonadota bacterium]
MKLLLAAFFALFSTSALAADRWEPTSFAPSVSAYDSILDQNAWYWGSWWKKYDDDDDDDDDRYDDDDDDDYKKKKNKKKKKKKCKWRCAKKVPELSVGGAVGSIGLLAGLGLILRERRKRN